MGKHQCPVCGHVVTGFEAEEFAARQNEHAAAHDLIEELRFALAAVDHTLTVHGHIDADTPLHEVVRAAIAKAAP